MYKKLATINLLKQKVNMDGIKRKANKEAQARNPAITTEIV